jgi:DNA (cytosine-5)-methyltransferase 1
MTHASVFSGIGGPEVAASMLGWENLFHCEINPFGRAVLDYWYPNAESYEDITKTDFTRWQGRVDVLTGGFPCQPFSVAGQRRGAQDDRYLWPFMFKCIDQIRPTWVVGENVVGILTMVEQGKAVAVEDAPTLFGEDGAVHRYEYRSTFTLERICSDLETHGYEVQPILIPACAVGAPHRRDRVFIVARRIDADTDGCRGASPREGAASNRQGTDFLQRPSGRGQGHASERNNGFSAVPRDAADTESIRQLDGHRQKRDTVAGRPYLAQTERCINEVKLNGQPQFITDTSEDGSIAGCGRWTNFPTVSPVHRGNDGLPFDVDCLTIPFTKWRNEALKAYGNAIVPQVMYEIFRAIEQVENERKQ